MDNFEKIQKIFEKEGFTTDHLVDMLQKAQNKEFPKSFAEQFRNLDPEQIFEQLKKIGPAELKNLMK